MHLSFYILVYLVHFPVTTLNEPQINCSMFWQTHLCENVLHLRLLVSEALDFLANAWVLLQFLQGRPFTVQIGAGNEKSLS